MLLVQYGFTVDYVMDLDIHSFDSLVQSMNRLTAADKIETAWTNMIASQASSKEMKKWTKKWEPAASELPTPKAEKKSDMGSFLSKFGGGF